MELIEQSQDDNATSTVQSVTDQIYHTLSMLEQLSVRLEARCYHMDNQQHTGAANFRTGHMQKPDYRAIAPLLEDDSVNDILVNGAHQVYVERKGMLELTDIQFESEDELIDMATEIAQYCGRVLDSKNTLVDARLPDGSRVNIVTPPVAIDGMSLSIRKFGGGDKNLSSMVSTGSMSKEMAEFLRCAAKAQVNMVISGGTGSGKTTLLNAICKHIPENERVVTIEDSAELQLPIPHVVRLESISHEANGGKIISIRDLVKNALRMRPNRIIVGEVRGAEAFDMIQAMNTGHDGSLTTIHANTPRDGVARIENMIGMASLGLPTQAIRKQISSAVHFIVQAERNAEGKRYINKISEVVGMEGDIITMQDIFLYSEQPQRGSQSNHSWSGVFPRHAGLNKMLRDAGILKMGV